MKASCGFAWVWHEVFLIIRFLLWSRISLEVTNKFKSPCKILYEYDFHFWRIFLQLSRSESTKKVWYFKWFRTFLQIKLHTHIKHNLNISIIWYNKNCSTKLSEGQQIQYFRTSNHSIIILLYKYYLWQLKNEIDNAICILCQRKHLIFKLKKNISQLLTIR